MKTYTMIGVILACSLLSVSFVSAGYFIDDFNRADNKDVDNDWTVIDDGKLDIQIENNQLVISGQQDGAWTKTGLMRNVAELGEIKSIHLRLQTTVLLHPWVYVNNKPKAGYFELSAGPGWHWVYTNSDTGAWNGWVDPPNRIVLKAVDTIGGDVWVEVGIFQTAPGVFKATLDDNVTFEGLENVPMSIDPVTEIGIGAAMDVGKAGTIAIDDFEINREDVQAVTLKDKLTISWGKIKSGF